VSDDDARVLPLAGRPFGALVVASTKDAEAACALAAAYARLAPEGRARMIDAVAGDARAERVDPLAPLAALLAVEDEPGLAARIRDVMLRSDALPAGRGPTGEPRAMMATLAGGVRAAILVRPLYGPFADVLAIAWREGGGVTHALVEPLVREDAIEGVAALLPDGLTLEPTPYARARDHVVDALWGELREGRALPAEIAGLL
jgi:hypothetical protein